MLEEVFFFINLSNLSVPDDVYLSVPDDVYLSVPDGGYSRNASRAH
jgi:hypothetical protein